MKLLIVGKRTQSPFQGGRRDEGENTSGLVHEIATPTCGGLATGLKAKSHDMARLEKVDKKGNVIGFSILNVSSMKEPFLDVDLANVNN